MKKKTFKNYLSLVLAFVLVFSSFSAFAVETDELTMEDFRIYGLNETYDDGATIGNENAFVIPAAAETKVYTITSNEEVTLSGDVVIEFDYYEPSFANFANGMYIFADSVKLMYVETSNGKVYTSDFSKNFDAIGEAGWYSFKIKFNSDAETFTVYCGAKGGELSELFTASGTIDSFTQLKFQVMGGTENDTAAYVDNVKAYTEKTLPPDKKTGVLDYFEIFYA